MPKNWEEERQRAVQSFEAIADLYGKEFGDKLRRKSFDLELVQEFTMRLPSGLTLLEVGAGPAQLSSVASEIGARVLMSDASEAQIRTAIERLPHIPPIVADLRELPFSSNVLGGIAAYYCLMYGSAEHLPNVFEEWWRVLATEGVVFIAVHAGNSFQRMTEWRGRQVDIELIERDPELTLHQLRATGFDIVRAEVRDPMPEEHPSRRLFILARKPSIERNP